VRPVIGSGKARPSDESRDHVVWEEAGLLTVTGGKLTTFRLIAHDALRAVQHRLPDIPALDKNQPALDRVALDQPVGVSLDTAAWRRLLGRYGAEAPALVTAAQPGELECIPGTLALWAELRWAARSEGVVHLDDLLLRRVRLGLLLPQGGAGCLARVQAICQAELGWDAARWAEEVAAYQALWQRSYGLPDHAAIPNGKAQLAAHVADQLAAPARRALSPRAAIFAGALVLLATAFGVAALWWRRRRNQSPSASVGRV
jgi:glycerol-3-phosphate dehydrogenase